MSITRVHYRERQRLLAADLRAEQEYRLGIAGRHHVAPHRWGVVRGLEVVQAATGEWVVLPGVAVDGYGREIVVAMAQLVPGGAPQECAHVVLYHCDEPDVACSPGDGSTPQPARIAQAFRLRVVPGLEPRADDFSDLAGVRAAGSFAGLPAWPVVLARLGVDCVEHATDGDDDNDGDGTESPAEAHVDRARTRYVAHRACSLQSPTGNAVLQLGLSSYSDVFHFSLSTRAGEAALERRLGIDRSGMLHVWRTLAISGADATGTAQLANGASLRVRASMPAGIGRRLLVRGQLDRQAKSLSISLLGLGSPTSPVSVQLAPLEPGLAATATLAFTGMGEAHFTLLDTVKQLNAITSRPPAARRSRARARRATREPVAPPAVENLSAQLVPSGGILELQALTPKGPPPALQLRQGGKRPPQLLLRELHTLRLPTEAPQTELRINGGAEDTSARLSRFGVGGRVQGSWASAFSMDGRRGLSLRGLDAALPPVLVVQGTLFLPPIGKDDPLLPTLMAQAFASGLRQMGRVATEITLSFLTLPEVIVRGDALTYQLNIKCSGSQKVTIKHGIEQIAGADGSGPVLLRSLTNLPAEVEAGKDVTVDVPPLPAFGHAADQITIGIDLVIGIGTATHVATRTSDPIAVEDPPVN